MPEMTLARSDMPDLAGLSFPALDLNRPAADQIFDAVKHVILTTSLPPGCLISEQDIGMRFGASRTPVREAFQRLRAEGLIVTRPSRGNYVSRLSEQRIREAQYIREALELANVRQLCRQGVEPLVADALLDTLRKQERGIAEGDDMLFQQQDDLFHALLARATGHMRAESLLIQEKSALDRLRAFSLHEANHTTRLLSEHGHILEAILERNHQAADEAMRHHLRSILDVLSDLISANHAYFDDTPSS